MGYPPQGVAGGGITNLSELTIDITKNWQQYGISNLAAVMTSAAKGDLIVRDDLILIRLPPGNIGEVLTSAGPLHLPTWAPPASPLELWYPVWIDLGAPALNIIPVDQSAAESGAVATQYSTPGATKQPAVSATEAAAKVSPDHTDAETAPGDTLGCLCDAVSGALNNGGGDETAANNDNTADDVTLLPAVPALNNVYLWGYTSTFAAILIKQSTIGAGVWTITWEYWNGAAWVGLAGVTDESNGFRQGNSDSILRVSWTNPGGAWSQSIEGGLGPFYWVRARVSAYTSIATQPLGRRVWIERSSV